MSILMGLLTMSLMLTAACAPARFGTKFALAPTMADLGGVHSEEERREVERRQEVALLKAEKARLGRSLAELYSLSPLAPIPHRLHEVELAWDRYEAYEREDIARALDRLDVISVRKNMLTGRLDADDQDLTRIRALREDLRHWRPKPLPYYAH